MLLKKEVSTTLLDTPNIFHSTGVEIWYNSNSNLVFVRLKPHKETITYQYHHLMVQYSVAEGEVRFITDEGMAIIRAGSTIRFFAGQRHFALNATVTNSVMILRAARQIVL